MLPLAALSTAPAGASNTTISPPHTAGHPPPCRTVTGRRLVPPVFARRQRDHEIVHVVGCPHRTCLALIVAEYDTRWTHLRCVVSLKVLWVRDIKLELGGKRQPEPETGDPSGAA